MGLDGWDGTQVKYRAANRSETDVAPWSYKWDGIGIGWIVSGRGEV